MGLFNMVHDDGLTLERGDRDSLHPLLLYDTSIDMLRNDMIIDDFSIVDYNYVLSNNVMATVELNAVMRNVQGREFQSVYLLCLQPMPARTHRCACAFTCGYTCISLQVLWIYDGRYDRSVMAVQNYHIWLLIG